MVINLVQNMVLLLGLITLYSLTSPLRSNRKTLAKIVMGLIFGGVAIIGMRIPFNYAPGVFYDGRSIILSLAGLFGGEITVLCSIIIAGVYRAIVGGNGIWAGLATILSTGLVGLAFNHYLRFKKREIKIYELFIFGIIVHFFMLASQLLVKPWPAGVAVIKQIWLPVLGIFPLTTMLMGIYLKKENDRIKTQIALKESTERYQNLVNQSQDLIFRFRLVPEQKFEFVNPYCLTLCGYTPEEFYQHPEIGFSMIYKEDQAQFNEASDGTMLYKRPFSLRWVRKDGRIIWVEMRNTPVFDDKGNLIAIEGIIRDITERKDHEQSLIDYNERLEKEVAARTQELKDAQKAMLQHDRMATMGRLAAGIAHELRNPLGVISNAVYFLKLVLQNANDKTKEYLGILEKESRVAVEIMNDMLNFTTLQAGDRQPSDIGEIVNRTLTAHPVPEGIIIHTKIAKKIPAIFVDPHQIEQVLQRLITNASEAMVYTGKISITAHYDEKIKDDYLQITISDDGPGILPENVEHLFEPLFSTKPRHIGLGLPIAKRLIEVNGGSIEVRGDGGKGATFVISLPLKQDS